MQPPQLRKTAEELLAHAQKIDQALKEIDADIRSLRGHRFIGHRADAVQAHYAPKRDALLNAKQMVINFAEELTTVASVFEKADNGGRGDRKAINAGIEKELPKDMRDLAKATDKLYGESKNRDGEKVEMPDVEIVKVGENEYVVIWPGTKGGFEENNWGGAISSGAGFQTPFEKQVLEHIQSKIPEGATINFVGHSQGGILAQNIVEHESDKGLSGYNIKSVTTFGAPQSAYRIAGVEYHDYAIKGDIVPLLDQDMLTVGNLRHLAYNIGGNLLYDKIVGVRFADQHRLYDDVVAQTPMPFSVNEWQVVDSFSANIATTGLATFEAAWRDGGLTYAVETKPFEFARFGVLGEGTIVSNTIESYCPDALARQIDRFSESTLPYVADGVVYVGEKSVEIVGETFNAASYTVDYIGAGVDNAVAGAGNFFDGLF